MEQVNITSDDPGKNQRISIGIVYVLFLTAFPFLTFGGWSIFTYPFVVFIAFFVSLPYVIKFFRAKLKLGYLLALGSIFLLFWLCAPSGFDGGSSSGIQILMAHFHLTFEFSQAIIDKLSYLANLFLIVYGILSIAILFFKKSEENNVLEIELIKNKTKAESLKTKGIYVLLLGIILLGVSAFGATRAFYLFQIILYEFGTLVLLIGISLLVCAHFKNRISVKVVILTSVSALLLFVPVVMHGITDYSRNYYDGACASFESTQELSFLPTIMNICRQGSSEIISRNYSLEKNILNWMCYGGLAGGKNVNCSAIMEETKFNCYLNHSNSTFMLYDCYNPLSSQDNYEKLISGSEEKFNKVLYLEPHSQVYGEKHYLTGSVFNQYSKFFIYNSQTGKKTLIFTDDDKEYYYPFDESYDGLGLKNNNFYFRAKDRITWNMLNIKFDIENKKLSIYDTKDRNGWQNNVNTIYEIDNKDVIDCIPKDSIIMSKSPNGKKVLYYNNGIFATSDNYENSVQLDNQEIMDCTSGAEWLPDSKRILIHGGSKGCAGNGDFIIDFDGKNLKKLEFTLSSIPEQPTSSNGDFFAIIHTSENRIAVIDSATLTIKKDIAPGYYAYISSDGKKILYKDNGKNVFLLDVYSGKQEMITENGIPIGFIN
jgi:hypothetical protein